MPLKLIPVRVPEKDYRKLRKMMEVSGDIHLATYCRRILSDHIKEAADAPHEAKTRRTR